MVQSSGLKQLLSQQVCCHHPPDHPQQQCRVRSLTVWGRSRASEQCTVAKHAHVCTTQDSHVTIYLGYGNGICSQEKAGPLFNEHSKVAPEAPVRVQEYTAEPSEEKLPAAKWWGWGGGGVNVQCWNIEVAPVTSSGSRQSGADPSLSNLHSLETLICCAVTLASKPSRTATPAAKRDEDQRLPHHQHLRCTKHYQVSSFCQH